MSISIYSDEIQFGPYHLVSNLAFERAGGDAVKAVKKGNCFKNPAHRVMTLWGRSRAADLARIKAGNDDDLHTSDRCSRLDGLLDGRPLPAKTITYKTAGSAIIVPVPPMQKRVLPRHMGWLAHFGDPFYDESKFGERDYAFTVTAFKTAKENTASMMDMAKRAVLAIVDENGRPAWPYDDLRNRFTSSRQQCSFSDWVPAEAPLSATEKIMQTGWNMSALEMFEEVSVDGIRFRTHRKDEMPGTIHTGSGIIVETSGDNGESSWDWGIIQRIFKYKL